MFERERHLDKQQDLLEGRADQLQKQEKMVEGNHASSAKESKTPIAGKPSSTTCSTSSDRRSTKSAA